MRPGSIRSWALAALCCVPWAACAKAAVGATGSDREGDLLARFAAAFTTPTEAGAAALADDEPTQGRCGTPLVIEYLAHRDGFSPATIAFIDDFLTYASAGDTLLSEGGHFHLSWDRDGDNAVPLADIDPADGIPDFVARIAGYLEQAWSVAVSDIGFRAPPGGPVPVSFRRMHFYGYTVPVDPAAGTTRIVLHNSFGRFPPNDDPDGNAAGSAKVTAAHEFRHVSQYVGSRWSEAGWTELDATWVEERTCEGVNDYHHYLLGDSPVRRPHIPLNAGASGTGSYDDAVFGIWLNRRWGDDAMRDYWEHRAAAPAEDPLDSWDVVLGARGTSLARAWADFTGWNFATGLRATSGLGYPDAADYPTGDLVAALDVRTFEIMGFVDHLAAAPVLLTGLDELGDQLLAIDFDGADEGGPLSLALHVRRADGTATLESVGLDPANDARIVLRERAGDLLTVGVVIGNPSRDLDARLWTLAVDTLPGPPAPLRGRVTGAAPNPANGAAWFTCEMSAGATTSLDVVDAAGRRVRRLWHGHLGPGSHRFLWDGRDEGGRPAPAGVYTAWLSGANARQGRKVTLVR